MYQLAFEIMSNPDRDHGDWRESHTLTAKTIDEIRTMVRDFQGENNIGGGNWGVATLTQDGNLVGYMSYNGRIWKGRYWEGQQEEVI